MEASQRAPQAATPAASYLWVYQEATLCQCEALCMGVAASPRRSQNSSKNSSMLISSFSKYHPLPRK
jgi:hypothetical protein